MIELDTSLLMPMLVLAAWSLIILFVLIGQRVRHSGKTGVQPQDMRTPELAYANCTESINNMANNFKHLFEVPVLFYVVCIVATLAGATSGLMATLAWVFVGLRVVHSVIQSTINVVMLRLAVFATSVTVLVVMMAVTALSIS